MDADLVLEGGGVKGIGLVGAYTVLKEEGYTFHRIAGTSAGAIVGALVAADIPVAEIHRIMRKVDYGKFQDQSFLDHLGLVGKGLSILFDKGIFEGDYLTEWLRDVLARHGKETFADLKLDDPGSALRPEQSYRLVVMASDVSRGRLVRLPWDYPLYGLKPDDQSIAEAVRASMSIPFFYEPVKFKAEDNGKESVSYLVDGGMLSNFPVAVFDRKDNKPPRWPTFGVKLSARPESAQRQRFEIDGTLEFARAVVGTMMSWYDQMHIDDEAVLARTMFVDTTGVRATDFDLHESTQEKLYEEGREAAIDFLKVWDWQKYLETYRSQPLAEGEDVG
jgi:NTE family protein